jgi:ribosomal protein S18 acetylase RimI-like enzyme
VTEDELVDGFRFRRPTEDDHATIVTLIDEWWGGLRVHGDLPRFWFQQFTGTSWIVDAADGRPAGFIVGFIGQDDPSIAVVHLVATSPNHRRRGLGRAMYERFLADAGAHGATRIRAIAWAANRVAVAFHRAMGFQVVGGPGSQNLYGVTAFADYDYPGEDRVAFERDLEDAGR